MATFTIKQGDTRPVMTATLTGADGTAQVLTGATVKFNMRNARGLALDHATCVVTDATNGVVEYRWVAGDTAASGTYEAEFEVTFADSNILTFPNTGSIAVVIVDQID